VAAERARSRGWRRLTVASLAQALRRWGCWAVVQMAAGGGGLQGG
jgi:hypothetical protein